MRKVILFTCLLLLSITACKTVENRPGNLTEPHTIAQSIEINPDKTEIYKWIDETEFDETWLFVDEFPGIKNGLRDLQQRISKTVDRYPSESCEKLKGERVIYQFIINKEGIISKINSNIDGPNECLEMVQITIVATEFTPGKVTGEPVATLFSLPLKF